MLRGSSASMVDGQKMSIAVSEPHKAKGIFAGVLYTILTKYGDSETPGSKSEFSVTRSYDDICNLYRFLMLTYRKEGVIIPPPPTKGNLGLIQRVSTARSENLTASAASRIIEKKCVGMVSNKISITTIFGQLSLILVHICNIAVNKIGLKQ